MNMNKPIILDVDHDEKTGLFVVNIQVGDDDTTAHLTHAAFQLIVNRLDSGLHPWMASPLFAPLKNCTVRNKRGVRSYFVRMAEHFKARGMLLLTLSAILFSSAGCAALGRQSPPLKHSIRVINYKSLGHPGIMPTYRLVPVSRP